MKFTLSWLLDHLDTSASLTEIVDALTRVGLEVESVDDPSRKYRRLRGCFRHRGQAASQRRPAQGLHRRRGPRAGAGRLRRAERPHRDEGRLLSGRHIYSRQEDDARQGRHPRRRIKRHAVFGGGARAQRRSRGDHRARGRRAGRRRLRTLCRARRSGYRRRGDTEPPRRRRRRGHRARSRRGGVGQPEDAGAEIDPWRLRLPDPACISTSPPPTSISARRSPCVSCAA